MCKINQSMHDMVPSIVKQVEYWFSALKLSESAKLDGKENGFQINSITVPGNCYLLTRYKT